jgi:acyl-coenzyme A thioesterase PaaI-like protein
MGSWQPQIDSACGHAVLTVTAAGADVLTVECEINLLARAAGERLVARGRVVRSGRTLTVDPGDAVAIGDGIEKRVATLLATPIARFADPS